MPTNKVRDEILDSLGPELKSTCLAYLAALAEEKRLGEIAKAAVIARRGSWQTVSKWHQKINENYEALADKAVVFNLKNGRFYEVQIEKERGSWSTFRHLNAKTGRANGQYATYAYGPRLLLPNSHPFVKKRANARLAERLEGKDV